MNTLIEEILLYLPKIKKAWSTELLHIILTKGCGSRNTRLAYTRKRTKQIEKDLKMFYEDTDYYSMDNDVSRNNYFYRAIKDATINGLLHWVEIGPGSLGTLTKMILKANSNTSVVAIEVVDSSVKLLTSKLHKWVQQHRVSIIEGLAGNVAIGNIDCDVLIAEVLGNIASNEGWTATLHALGKQNPHWKTTIKQIIPAQYGTKLVPVDLSKASSLNSNLVIGNKLAFIPSLPFSEIQLTNHHGFMERYDALHELQSGCGRDPQCQRSTFYVGKTCPFHGLALYVVYGNDYNDNTWQHSNSDLPNASTNWYNVFIPVSKGQFVCETDDKIVVDTKVWVDTHYPMYNIKVQITRGEEIKMKDTITFNYYDLVCTRCPIYGWK
jgi:hypothetical protein